MIRTLSFLRLFWMLFSPMVRRPDLKRIEKMGLLAIKIGQMYGLRSDFLSVEKCQHLSQLYESVDPISSEKFSEILKKEAPESFWEAVFMYQEEPLATASLGQVHRGVLKNGEEIVIKVIKHDFKKSFQEDIRTMRQLLKVLLFFYPKLKKLADPIGTLETIQRTTLTELDLRNEEKGIKRLKNLRKDYLKDFPHLNDMIFPKIYSEFSGERVLVSEFVSAPSLNTLLREKKLDYEVLLKLFRIHGFYLLLLGEFHGDIHPGNILLQDPLKLCFLDNSNIEKVPADFGQNMLRLLYALGQGDFKKAAKVLHNSSTIKLSQKDYAHYEGQFLKLYKGFHEKTVSQVSMSRQIMNTVKLAIHSGMEFPEGMFSLVKSLMYLDGMVLKCNPDAKMMQDILRFEDDFKKML